MIGAKMTKREIDAFADQIENGAQVTLSRKDFYRLVETARDGALDVDGDVVYPKNPRTGDDPK